MIKISPYIPSYTTSYLCNVAYYDNRNGLASLKETRSYNLRSWLTNIDGQMFTEVLKYENSTIPQWGGNISVMQWGESAVQNAYSFIYDTHSRLMTANYSNASSVGLYSEIYNYDLNGNMLRHVRVPQALVMNYSGNRLTSAGNAAFEYDAKGRQVMSAYGSGLSTEYNILDLPQRQTTGEGTVVDYKYAFDGMKLQEKVMAGASVTQRDYSGEFLYEGGVLKKILFDGGYVINGESGPVYMFFLRDHLGSVRAVVSETGAVQQMNNYFPYGDLFPNTSNDSSGNRYKYTGKESGDETDLYDFSARFLHTRFGRFTTIDPLAEKYPGISPYAYCNGNPVNFVDPDGMDFRKVVRMNTITIKAHYYVKRDSYESAANARDFWNKRQDTYLSPSGKQFDVKYKITIQSVDNIDVFKKNSNTYEVVDSFESKSRAGVAADKRNIQVLESYSLTLPNSQIQSTTGAHEIGHTLGMSDGGQGIMSGSQDESRTNDVTQDNLQQMLESAAGKDDMLSKLFNYIFKVYD